jgi:hypothetical protein
MRCLLAGQEIFLLSTEFNIQSVSMAHSASYQTHFMGSLGTIDHCGRGARAKKAHPLYIHSWALSPAVKQMRWEAEHIPPSGAKVQNGWSYTSTLHTPS